MLAPVSAENTTSNESRLQIPRPRLTSGQVVALSRRRHEFESRRGYRCMVWVVLHARLITRRSEFDSQCTDRTS